ncbi:hypothetical protein IQ07DRAFT_572300 [Pyrenochaeta sp. DS3sAY3a]|nr:hypothetical protein IQ07DRAFT_572300 [Pyrenochaeta sp. DS3sAY3a]
MRLPLRPQWHKQPSVLPWLPLARLQNIVPRRIATTSSHNAAPVDIPKLIITPGSVHHNSLPSFLEYAKRTNLTPETTFYVGTHYEYATALALLRLGFSLLRVGRKDDAGIDLIGHWVLAPLREPLPIIIQCKARKISLSPANIRELEGSFRGIPADWRGKDVLGLLVTTKKATKGVLEALGQSRLPMGFVLVSREGSIQQFVWNRAASNRGLEGVGPAIRKDIQLTWMGSPIFPDRKNLDDETLKLMSSMAPEEDVSVGSGSYAYKVNPARKGRPRTFHSAPSPRGGGGDKGPSEKTTKPAKTTTTGKAVPTPKPRGRPKGSKNKPKPRRGRPKGSKNKPKARVDPG